MTEIPVPARDLPAQDLPARDLPAEQAATDASRASAATENFEVERKYEVTVEATLPHAEVFTGLGLVAEAPQLHDLEAEYFDTASGDLAGYNFALRHRRGGKDAGWHLKHRGPEGVREWMWPSAPELPEELAEELYRRTGIRATVPVAEAEPEPEPEAEPATETASHTDSADGAASLHVIARLHTSRNVVMLRDEQGRDVVELADDRVRAQSYAEPHRPVTRVWREWEAELMPGADAELLNRIEPALLAAGAVVSQSPAKIARATGRLVQLARARGADAAEVGALVALDAADQAAARRLDA